MALSVAPLTTTVMGAVEAHRAGLASGINNAISRMAGLLAISLMGILVFSVFNAGLDNRLDTLEIPSEVRIWIDGERARLAAIEVPAWVSGQTRMALERSIDEAFVSSFRLAMIVAAALGLGSAITASVTIEPKTQARPSQGA